MTYQQILEDILTKTNIRAIVTISPYAGVPLMMCSHGKDIGGIVGTGHTEEPLTVTVLDVQGDKCENRNIQIIAYDRGLVGDVAWYAQQTSPDSVIPIPDSVLALIAAYVTSLGVRNYAVISYNASQRFAIVDAWIDTATTCSLKRYRILHDGATIVHREVV